MPRNLCPSNSFSGREVSPGYTICRAQCKMKNVVPLLNNINNFKIEQSIKSSSATSEWGVLYDCTLPWSWSCPCLWSGQLRRDTWTIVPWGLKPKLLSLIMRPCLASLTSQSHLFTCLLIIHFLINLFHPNLHLRSTSGKERQTGRDCSTLIGWCLKRPLLSHHDPNAGKPRSPFLYLKDKLPK